MLSMTGRQESNNLGWSQVICIGVREMIKGTSLSAAVNERRSAAGNIQW